jgi:sulfur carrier protein ThiS
LLKGRIVFVNNTERVLSTIINVNGQTQSVDYKIQDQDRIEIKNINTIKELLNFIGQPDENTYIEINGKKADNDSKISNGDKITLNKNSSAEPKKTNNASVKSITVKLNGKDLTIEQNKDSLMFLEIFNHIDLDVSRIKGVGALKLNGINANYTDKIKNGDIIEIQWEK